MANVALYAPSPIAFDTHDPTQVANWAQNEFQILSRTLANLARVQFGVQNTPPPQPRTGLFAYADGTNWNPGSGEGLYEYQSDGTWHFVGFTATAGGGLTFSGGVFAVNPQYPIALSGNSPPSGITANAVISRQQPHHGFFGIVNSVTVQFIPFEGDLVKINGFLYQIPVGGIVSNNTNCFIDGVGGQNLAANTTYYAYLFNNNGTLTIDFSTTGYGISATAPNIGNTVKNVGGGDSRTLIGLLRTNGSAQFVNSAIARQVISWYNRRPQVISQGFGNNTATNVNGVVAALFGGSFSFVTWGDVTVSLSLECQVTDNCNTGNAGAIGFGDNSTTSVFVNQFVFGTNGIFVPTTLTWEGNFSEGFHTITLNGYANTANVAAAMTYVNTNVFGTLFG